MALACACGDSRSAQPDGGADAEPDAAVEDLSSMRVTPRRLRANGVLRAKVVVEVRDANGPLADRTVSLSSDGPLTITPMIGKTDANGLFVATVAGTTPGLRKITAVTSASKVLDTTITLTSKCDAPLLPGRPTLALENAQIGDANGDGVLDLYGSSSGGLGIAFGNDDGTFQTVEGSPAGFGLTPPVLADFTGDGVVDAVGGIPGATSASVGVMKGNGDGTFGPWNETPLTVHPINMHVGDFDLDGKLDVAFFGFSATGSALALMFGRGDGTFHPALTIPSTATSNNSTVMTAVDLDGDDDLDIVTSGNYTTHVAIHVNNGDRTFEAPMTITHGLGGAGTLSAGDIDGNGTQDLIVTAYITSGGVILRNSGNLTFPTLQPIATGGRAMATLIADVDANGSRDLVFGDGRMLYTVLDPLTSSAMTTLDAHSSSLAIADLDHDNKLDLVASGGGTSVARGDGFGGFDVPAIATAAANAIAVGDFNADGDPDIATVPFEYGSDQVRVQLGNGDGTFAAPAVYATGPDPSQTWTGTLLAADVDGNGSIDLAASNEVNVTLLTNNGSGGFTPSTVLELGSAERHRGFAIADFNADDRLDIAITREPWVGTPYLQVSLQGTAGFGSPAEYAFANGGGYMWFLATGDVDANGSIDIVSFPPQLHRNAGNGTFTAPTAPIYNAGSFADGGILLADQDGDGKRDIIVAGTTGMPYFIPALLVLRGTGDGSFDSPVTLAANQYGQNPVAIADVNKDGHLDIVASGNSMVGLLLGRGDGAYEPLVYYATNGDSQQRATVADFNNDGLPDLATPGGVLIQNMCVP